MRLVNMGAPVHRRGQRFSPWQTFEAKRAQRAPYLAERTHCPYAERRQALRRHLWRDHKDL